MSTSAIRIQSASQTASGDNTRRSRNVAPVAIRSALPDGLACALTAMLDVSMAARQAHWNVRGPAFYALHDLFGRIQKDLDEQADELAERIAALGGIPCGTVQAVATTTRMPAYPLLGTSENQHLEAMASRLAALGTTLRAALIECEHSADTVTAHLLTEAWARVDKLRWLVESQSRK